MNLKKHLNKKEIKVLEEALALITVLVAGADGNVDEAELNWAHQLAEIRTYFGPEELHPLYRSVADGLYEEVKALLDELPGDKDRRKTEIEKRLGAVNPILAKLDSHTGAKIYKSLKTYARKIAKSSGGVFGLFSISLEELNVIDLKMINPID